MSALLVDLGIAPENVLRRARLPLDLLNRDPARLSIEEYLRLWEGLVAEQPDPTLPIRLGQTASPETFHPAIFAALCSSCLSVAVQRLAEHKRLIAPMHMIIEDSDEGLYVSWQWDDPTVQSPVSLMATELVFMTQLARIGTRSRVEPVQVTFPLPLEPRQAYAEYFGVPLKRAERHSLTFSPADAAQPFLTASESMWAAFEPELKRRLTKLDAQAPLAERVRSALLECLPGGESSIDAAARRLGLSRRTLQRQLAAEGVAFRDLVRDTRERLSRHYLTNTTISFGEIAFLVGFDEPSSFFRAFRDWTGTTPQSLRVAAASG